MKPKIHYLYIVLLLVIVPACSQRQGHDRFSGTEGIPPGLFLNMTADPVENPHSTLMGLHLGQKALDNGMPLTVFLNVAGVKLLLPGADTIVFHGENLYALLGKIMDDGGEVLACPHCMHITGVDERNLPEGVKVAADSLLIARIKGRPVVFNY